MKSKTTKQENTKPIASKLGLTDFEKQLDKAGSAELFKEIVQRFAQIENPNLCIDALTDIYIEWSQVTKEQPGTDRYNTLALNMQFAIELLRDIREQAYKQELIKASIRACE